MVGAEQCSSEERVERQQERHGQHARAVPQSVRERVDTDGTPVRASRVSLAVANPGRDIARIAVPLTRHQRSWTADYRFPLTGTWSAILTVDGIGPTAIVSAGDILIR